MEYGRSMSGICQTSPAERGGADRKMTSSKMAASVTTLFECGNCAKRFNTLDDCSHHTCDQTNGQDMSQTQGETSGTSQGETSGAGNESTDLALTEGSDSTSTNMTKGYVYWTRPATLLLIATYKSLIKEVNRGALRKKSMWDKIERVFAEKEYSFTADQISGRWKTLHRSYKAVHDNNSKSGSQRKEHEYQTEMDELCQKDPALTPVCILSSSQPTSDRETVTPEIKPERVKRPRSTSLEAVSVMREFVASMETKKKQEEERREKQHSDRMDMMKTLIDVIAKK